MRETPINRPRQGHKRRSVLVLGILVAAAMGITACGGASTTTVTTTSSSVIRMPSVIDRRQADAAAILRRAGFKLSYLAAPNSATPGTVTTQYPAPGSRFAKGSEVTLTISARPRAGNPPTTRGATHCGGSVEFTGGPRQAKGIRATLAHCGEALALVNNAHRLLNSCPKGEQCNVDAYSCTQAYYGGPTLFVRCVSRKPANAPGPVAEVQWEWGGY
ncbi:MAG: PASTA domain-containing protein [Solirubrobacterales bacterium]